MLEPPISFCLHVSRRAGVCVHHSFLRETPGHSFGKRGRPHRWLLPIRTWQTAECMGVLVATRSMFTQGICACFSGGFGPFSKQFRTITISAFDTVCKCCKVGRTGISSAREDAFHRAATAALRVPGLNCVVILLLPHRASPCLAGCNVPGSRIAYRLPHLHVPTFRAMFRHDRRRHRAS